MIPIYLFQQVANITNKYAYKDCVVEKTATDLDGNLKTNNYLSHCAGWNDGVETPGHCHRAYNESIKFQATPGYFLGCWISILILSGGQFGSVKKESQKKLHKPPHGLSIFYVKDAISTYACEFMRRNIYFLTTQR